MDLTPKQTQVQGVNGTMDHGFDPTIDTSTGCKWDHGFDPTTAISTGCKWEHEFDPTTDTSTQVQDGTMDLITSTGCKSDHGLTPQQTKVQV